MDNIQAYLARLETLATQTRIDELVVELSNAIGDTDIPWTDDRVIEALTCLGDKHYGRFLTRLKERGLGYGSRSGMRQHEHMQAMAEGVELALNGEAGLQEARSFLDNASRYWGEWEYHKLQACMAHVLRAGEAVPVGAIATARRTYHTFHTDPRTSEFRTFIDSLPGPILNPGEAWSDMAMADLSELESQWSELVMHTLNASGAKPTKAWEKTALQIMSELGPEHARELILSWLAETAKPRTTPLEVGRYDHAAVNDRFDSYNADRLRGLVWMLGLLPADTETARALGGLVETMLRKVPGVGPRNPKVANAAVYALSQIDGGAALGQLARLSSQVKFKGTLKQVDTALNARAKAMGLTREEIDELAVPDYGLTEVGRTVQKFGGASAELIIDGSAAKLVWHNESGKTVKSPPASVKRDFGDELKELKAGVKDITKMLSAQSERLDRQFLAQREWAFDAWRERYLDHPLVGTLARRLLWAVDGTVCGYADDRLRTMDDSPIDPPAGARVRLWHPIGSEVAEIMAWRDWLERHRIVQPFKQAHREVYLLTAAEENTGTYSNRFAAHIIRQHQFNALAAARGWHNKLRLMVDDMYPPATKALPQWGMRAEFWVEGIGDSYGADTTESGSYLRLATDQVRFYAEGANQNLAHAGGGGYDDRWGDNPPADPIPLSEVPALVLSEVLRDVDLFVGVASVGNDPAWSDGGPDGRYRDYWQSYSFGELTATATTRRQLLERLVPRLAIGERATVDGKFLVVRGDIRTYKIHLGSSNILMSPNDQYLCIVPSQFKAASQGDTFLPFEGDRVLSLILSKAILLSKDTTITDPTITSQIGSPPR